MNATITPLLLLLTSSVLAWTGIVGECDYSPPTYIEAELASIASYRNCIEREKGHRLENEQGLALQIQEQQNKPENLKPVECLIQNVYRGGRKVCYSIVTLAASCVGRTIFQPFNHVAPISCAELSRRYAPDFGHLTELFIGLDEMRKRNQKLETKILAECASKYPLGDSVLKSPCRKWKPRFHSGRLELKSQ